MPPLPTGTEAAEHDEALLKALRDPALEKSWTACLDAWADAEDTEREALAAYAAELRDGACGLLTDIAAGPDREAAVALLYVHLRSEWMLYNVRIGYMVGAGVWDQAAIYRASLLSSVLGIFEDALEEGGEAARVRRFLGHYNAAPAPDKESTVPPRGASEFRGEADAHLRTRLHSLQVELARHERERRRLSDELGGAPDIETLICRTRERSARIAELERELADLRAGQQALSQATGGGATDAADAAEQITRLAGRVSALEARLAQFTAERDLLRRELGVAEGEGDDLPSQAIALVGGLRQRVFRLGRDLAAVAADRDFLLRECTPVAGRSAPDDLRAAAAYVRELRDLLAEREAESGTLRDARERLLSEVGSADPEEIADEVRALRQGLVRAQRSVAGLLGEMNAASGPVPGAAALLTVAEPAPLPPIPAHLLMRRPPAPAPTRDVVEEDAN